MFSHEREIVFDNASILVTGGTGSFGNAFVERIISGYKPAKLVVFSRDEMKQWQMAKRFESNPAIRFFIGDVRDRERLYRALDGIDYVVHAAATKIVPTAEYNPFEAVKTNVFGAMNVIDASLDSQVKKVVALSTDKASAPVNLYGATKLVSDRLFTSAMAYAGNKGTSFTVVRYGNVMGSRGSVIPYFIERRDSGMPLRITDPRMTRFMISLDDAVSLVEKAFLMGRGGEVFVPRIPSMTIVDIAEAVDPDGSREISGLRPGEKIHEQMIGPEDAANTWEFEDHFRIVSELVPSEDDYYIKLGGARVPADFRYSSDTNSAWMKADELASWISTHSSKMLRI